MKKALLLLFIFLAVLAGTGIVVYQQMSQFLQQPIAHQPDQLLRIERGTTGKKLTALFQQEKLVGDAQWLPWILKLQPQFNQIKAGTYSLNGVNTMADLLALLNSGKEVQLSLRFTEGETWRQVKKNLENAPHLKKELDYQGDFNAQVVELMKENSVFAQFPRHIEGWIYPNTYHYTPNSSDKALLKRAIEPMAKALTKAWAEREADLPLKTPYEMLILASIVEKESGVQAERAKIASVFINRLKLKMKLQTDPTVIYGMGEQYQGNIRKKDLETPTAYNTYVIEGLPPTPIANPSESALMAVAKPENTDFLYFVADGSGGHKFSRTLAEHNRAVQDYLRWYRQNKDKK